MDAATRWETEAVRESRRPQVSQKRAPGRPWATLREAAVATGVPVGTIRAWAKTEEVATYLESDGETVLRMVDLDAVHRRAERLGRSGDIVVDIREAALGGPEDAAAAIETDVTPEPDDGQAETMIVPIDAWNKMLLQLGNLHEAGQQLAEARERAARAETEATFLRQQLRDQRAASVPAEPSSADQTPAAGSGADPAESGRSPASAEAVADDDTASDRISFIRYIYRGWRSRR